MAWLLSALLMFVALAAPAHAQDNTQSEEEIVVTLPGPEMWRVHDSDSELFLLAVVRPLPRRVQWNTRPFEARLRGADRFYLEAVQGADAGQLLRLMTTRRNALWNPDGAKLQDFLEPALYARVERAAAAADMRVRELERLRPLHAGSRLIRETAKQAGLSFDVDVANEARRKARRARVRVEEVAFIRVGALVNAMNALPLGADAPCLALQLDVVERLIPAMQRRAEAWAAGDAAALRAAAGMVDEAACVAALAEGGLTIEELMRRRLNGWRAIVDRALATPGRRVAAIDAELLLRPGGLLASLHAAGIAVEEP
ncbi:MAG: TraB/GumN family protein [Hydrogenophilaceae bacterium]|jgi:uncharacterized protein YbaP (TraB family)|nr:TraB/GumN family protein [Hydrogenophilaceae bacterium]